MNEYFNKINNTLFENLKGNEILKTSVWGENSQFIRVNGAKVRQTGIVNDLTFNICLLYTSPSPRDRTRSRMPSSA